MFIWTLQDIVGILLLGILLLSTILWFGYHCISYYVSKIKLYFKKNNG